MKNKIIIALLIVLLPSILICSNFYTNLFEKGKKLYLAGKYEDAAENFRIAEFGLIGNRVLLKDLYLYFSLAHFKLSHGDEVMKFTGKLKESAGVSRFEELTAPEEVKGDLDVMFSVIDKTYNKNDIKKNDQKDKGLKKAIPKNNIEYNTIYNKIRDSLNENDLPIVKSGFKKLKRLGKKDLRTRLIAGILYFMENNYKKAVNQLLPVSRTDSDDLVNESSYYLALSNYFLKNYGQFLAFAQKVTDKETNGKLIEIRKKVDTIRQAGINNIKDHFFNKKNFKNFVLGFNGDISLGTDILEEVEKIIPLRSRDIYYMADTALKYPAIYNDSFILGIMGILSEREQEEFAEDIVKRSKFFKQDSMENIEILYKLGLLYDEIGNKKNMKKIMLRVKQIKADYKKVNYYLTN